jgi:V8-like Glu-specific endopeptidase
MIAMDTCRGPGTGHETVPAMIGMAAMAAAICIGLPGCYSQSKGSPPPVSDYCGDIKRAVFPIINGTEEPDPSIVNLTGPQMNAVGTVITDDYLGEWHCTGTLIAPNTVLTAAHCISETNGLIEFDVGRDTYRTHRDAFFSGVEWHMHPMYPGYVSEYDIAIVIVGGDPIAEGVIPIPFNCETTSLVGRTVQVAGYGLTDPGMSDNTIRYWTTLPVTMETEGMYTTESEETSPCFGDSGGPLLYTKEDGETYVMGVVSGGQGRYDCLGYDLYPRTDFSCEFIQPYVSHEPCWGETPAGRCYGDRIVRCEGESVVIEDCDESGMSCEQEEGGQARCVPPPDPCEGETFTGRCDGNRAVWCAGETIIRRTCAGGELCGDAGDGLNRCVEECALIGSSGRCDETGSTARWCEDGVLKVRDCRACDQTCGWVSEAMGYYCI